MPRIIAIGTKHRKVEVALRRVRNQANAAAETIEQSLARRLSEEDRAYMESLQEEMEAVLEQTGDMVKRFFTRTGGPVECAGRKGGARYGL